MADEIRKSVFLDASALYPALLRNILMRCALRDLFSAFWSERVQDEWTRSVLRDRPDLSPARVHRTRRMMDENIAGANVTGFEHLIETLSLPDVDDRHVLAAAIHCRAEIIVTANLRDFPVSVLAQYKIQPQHPDVFLLGLINSSPLEVVAALRQILLAFKRPTITIGELLVAMERQGLKTSAKALTAYADMF